MTDIDPIHRITTTFPTADLRRLVSRTPPFLTVVLPAPSHHDDAEHRLGVRWRTARRRIGSEWSPELLALLDAHVDRLDHADGEAIVLVQSSDGTVFTELLTIGVVDSDVRVGDAPALVPLLEHRQRTLPHIVVTADRAGADLVAFDGGRVVDAEQVAGDTEHIHRGHPGGWSQRRFQQRAENTWERNADDVADAVVALARRVEPVLVTISGEVRARSLLLDSLDGRLPGCEVVGLESGDVDGAAEETLRRLSDLHARLQRATVERLRATGDAIVEPNEVVAALDAGRVAALLVNDRVDHEERAEVDRAVRGALMTSAPIVVVPTVAELTGGVAAISRW